MKTGMTESVAAGIMPKPELGLEADKVEESVDMLWGQGPTRAGRRHSQVGSTAYGQRGRVRWWTCGSGGGARDLGQWKG